MRRRLVHAGAWTLATGAAVTLSWWGVHTMLVGTSYSPPRALPVSGPPPGTDGSHSSPSQRPEPAPSTTPSTAPSRTGGSHPSGTPSASDSTTPGRTGGGHHTRKPATRTPHSGAARGASVAGGRAVFAMREDSASLVSATPNSGWDMRVWKSQQWIRVTFTSAEDGTAVSVFCRWDAGPPRIEKFQG